MTNTYLFLLVPVIGAGILHMVIVKWSVGQFLAIPVSTTLLGANKTWRGVVVMPVLSAIFAVVLRGLLAEMPAWEAGAIGLLTGLAYVVFEWPNSWLKRRLGVAAGQQTKRLQGLFMVLDKTDSAFGVSLTGAWLFGLSFSEWWPLFLIAAVLHAVLSILLVGLGIKKTF
jgi:hypothetical protein